MNSNNNINLNIIVIQMGNIILAFNDRDVTNELIKGALRPMYLARKILYNTRINNGT